MTEMSKQRKGEIALELVKLQFKRDGIKLSPGMRRQLGQTAKESGIPREELEQFTLELLPEMIGAALGFQRVGITTSAPVAFQDCSGGH